MSNYWNRILLRNGEKINSRFQVRDFALNQGVKNGFMQGIMSIFTTKSKGKRSSSNRKIILSTFLTIIIGLGVVTVSFAQPKINSPYSRIGLGDLADQNFSALRSIGGIAAAYHDPYHMNLLNPASLTYLNATSFEIGLDAKRSYLKNDDATTDLWSGNISYFSLGFPTKNPVNRSVNPIKSPFHWAMNFSLVPYSNVGYDINTEGTTEGGEASATYNFQGNGGTNKVVWGNGLRYNNIAIGLNLGYLFGKISNSRLVEFPDLEEAYFDRFNDEFSVKGVTWSLGMQYDYVFKKKNNEGELEPDGRRLTLGAYGNSQNNIKFNSTSLVRRLNPVYNTLDTLVSSNSNVKGKLPAEFGIGIAYTKDFKWRLGIDYSMAKWSQYQNEAKRESLVDSWRLAVGGNYTPNIRSYNNYFKKITYNFGAFYSKDARGSSTGDLLNYGVTTGIVMPIIMKGQASSINISLEMGQIGIDGGLKELYGKLTLGFTLNNNQWFLKRKFY